jgi:hypothetical protein
VRHVTGTCRIILGCHVEPSISSQIRQISSISTTPITAASNKYPTDDNFALHRGVCVGESSSSKNLPAIGDGQIYVQLTKTMFEYTRWKCDMDVHAYRLCVGTCTGYDLRARDEVRNSSTSWSFPPSSWHIGSPSGLLILHDIRI